MCAIASSMCILCGQSAVVVCSLRQADWHIGVGKVLLGRSFGQPAREVAVVHNICCQILKKVDNPYLQILFYLPFDNHSACGARSHLSSVAQESKIDKIQLTLFSHSFAFYFLFRIYKD